MAAKACFKCGESKPISQFYRHPMMADGHLGKCKECARLDVAANRQLKIARYREFDKQRANRPDRVEARREYNRTPRGRKAHAEACKWHSKLHPDRARARYAVNNAIRDGKIQRQLCEVCGAKAEAHHEDYSRPLEVRWLCEPHHKARHRELKATRRAVAA